MKLHYHLIALFVASCLTSQSATGAISLFGEAVEITGCGFCSAQIFILAIGQTEVIGGYNIEVDASNPNITFESIV